MTIAARLVRSTSRNLPRPPEVVPVQVDRIVRRFVAEADRHDMRAAILADGGDPREAPWPAAAQVLQLAPREHAHWLLRIAQRSSPRRMRARIASIRCCASALSVVA
jgi:hypothetical protein